MLKLNKYVKPVSQDRRDKAWLSSKELPRLGALFLRILSTLCLLGHYSLDQIQGDTENVNTKSEKHRKLHQR